MIMAELIANEYKPFVVAISNRLKKVVAISNRQKDGQSEIATTEWGGCMANTSFHKPNRYKNYDYSKSGGYFITICTDYMKQILSKIDVNPVVPISNRRKNSQSEIDTTSQSEIGTTRPSIPSIVRFLKSSVTKQCKESIFQQRYYDEILRSEKHYQNVSSYVLHNPVNWINDKYYEKS